VNPLAERERGRSGEFILHGFPSGEVLFSRGRTVLLKRGSTSVGGGRKVYLSPRHWGLLVIRRKGAARNSVFFLQGTN